MSSPGNTHPELSGCWWRGRRAEREGSRGHQEADAPPHSPLGAPEGAVLSVGGRREAHLSQKKEHVQRACGTLKGWGGIGVAGPREWGRG